MRLKRLQVRNFRNFAEATLLPDSNLNLIAGDNGSGKTSLLEAVHFLGSGRSFRGPKVESVTKRGQEFCLVTGDLQSEEFGTVSLGYQRATSGERVLRVNGETKHQASEMAKHLPNLLLGPQSVELLTGSPTERRNFLNRGVFHVEHSFGEVWAQGVRSLRQRNALLKTAAPDASLNPWTEQVIGYATKIDEMRRGFIEQFLPVFTETYRFLLDLDGVKCSYRRGWDQHSELQEIYAEQLANDRERGFTFSGFHRADLRFTIDGKPVSEICSRGELKLIAWSAILAQGLLLGRMEDRKPIYLVDDLTAELDGKHQHAVSKLLSNSGGQVLVTGTDADRLKALWNNASHKLFHVKQGSISEVETSE